MTDDTDTTIGGQDVYVVYTSGSDGRNFPYAVYTNRKAAEQAREAVIKRLEDTAAEEEALDLLHSFEGALDEQVEIKRDTLRTAFDGDVDDLFEDVDEE